MMRNIIRNWTACIGMVVTLAACDDYLDITPKGKALLKSTEDYLGLIEDRSPEYDMMNSWILAGEASWYKAEELKSYTNPLNSVAYFWDESYDRAGDMIENAAYNACYDRITKFNVVVDGIASSEGKEEDKRMGEAQARVLRAYNYFFLINTFARPYDPATAYQTHGIIVREKMFESLEDVGIQQSVGYTYDFIQRDIFVSSRQDFRIRFQSQGTFIPTGVRTMYRSMRFRTCGGRPGRARVVGYDGRL